MKDFKIILIAFLLGVSIFSAVRYVASLRDKRLLGISLEKEKAAVSVLRNEKQNLLQEIEKEKNINTKSMQANNLLKGNLKAGKNRLLRLFAEYNKSEQDNQRLSSQVSILKAENLAIRTEGDKLRSELAGALQENEGLNSRLGSIVELKKAIRDLKAKKTLPSVEIRKIEVKKKPITAAELTGNRGYLIKDGIIFSGMPAAKVKIEVMQE